MKSRYAILSILPCLICFGAHADLILSAGTVIRFGDNTMQDTAAVSVEIPAGHGGVNSTVSGTNAFVGGGENNIASAAHATVGGGLGNQAVTGSRATVGGGNGNIASGTEATVAGGLSNVASGAQSTVGGGASNAASGQYSAVPGGSNSAATATYSIAAGRRAKAMHTGAIILADGKDADFNSVAAHEFAVRATGGARVVTAISLGQPSAGPSLGPGDDAWSTGSARDLKENFKDVDSISVLEKLVGLPIQRWNYKHSDESVQHMGPMAEDFYAAFQLNGAYSGRITTQDFDGVELVAIQGVNRKLERELAARDRELERKQAQLDELEARLAALENLLADVSN